MTINNTGNTSALRRAEMYSDLVLKNLQDGGLPDGLHRDVSDFGDGDTLNIPTFGEVIIRDLDPENEDIPLDAVDNGSITLTIQKFQGGGTAFTDTMREDNYKAQAFDAHTISEYTRKIKESWETDLLNQQAKQASGINTVNGVAHRYVAGDNTTRTLTLDDIIYAKLAMDKALMPGEGRILIVDPIAEASLNSLTNLTNVSDNPRFEGIVETGFAKNLKFIRNVYGFDVFVSNKLPRLTATEVLDTSGAGVITRTNDTAEIGDIVNQAWCVADDMHTPIMGAWRRQPRVEGSRNAAREQDEFRFSARWGFNLQRAPAMVSIITSPTDI
jgi:hypothetical protein